MKRTCERMKRGPSGLKRCASYGAAPEKNQAALTKRFPYMQISFDILLADDDVEEDLKDPDEPARRRYAQQFLKKFKEGAGWFSIADKEIAKLSKMLGFKCKVFDSETGEVHGVETVNDVRKLWEAIEAVHGGGDDIIYLDWYVEVGNFWMFPEGYNGPRYLYGCAMSETCWEEWLEEQGAL